MKILYISLFPEHNSCNDIENLYSFIKSTSYHNYQDIFTYRLFTYHDNMAQQLKLKFNCEELNPDTLFKFENTLIQVEKLKLHYADISKLHNQLEHEKAAGKEKIYTFSTIKQVTDYFDFIFYNESNMLIDSKDILELCRVLQIKNNRNETYFINIPYLNDNAKTIEEDSFNSFILPKKILIETYDIIKEICQTAIDDKGMIYINNNADVKIKEELLNKGYKEIQAESCYLKQCINTKNYIEVESHSINNF